MLKLFGIRRRVGFQRLGIGLRCSEMYIVVSFDWLLVPHLVQKGLFRILYVWIQGSIKCEFATVMRDFDKNLDFVYFKIKIDIVFKPTI